MRLSDILGPDPNAAKLERERNLARDSIALRERNLTAAQWRVLNQPWTATGGEFNYLLADLYRQPFELKEPEER